MRAQPNGRSNIRWALWPEPRPRLSDRPLVLAESPKGPPGFPVSLSEAPFADQCSLYVLYCSSSLPALSWVCFGVFHIIT